MMKRLIATLFGVALSVALWASPGQAQVYFVATCGTVPTSLATLTPGNPGMYFVDTTGKLCVSGSGGGGGGAVTLALGAVAPGAYSAGSFVSGSGVDGWDVTEGSTTDAASAAGGTGSLSAKLRLMTTQIGAINTTLGSPAQAGTNQTHTPCSGSIGTGGTAQNIFAAQTTLHGFTIANIDTTEVMWISMTTTAAASGTDSYPLPPATATTFAGFGSLTLVSGLNHALSGIAATTNHKYSCTWW